MNGSTRITRALAAWLTGLLLAGAVLAHGDEDHSAPGVAATAHLLPRLAVTTEEFELVAVLEPGRLLIHLDRADSNQPVAQAQIEVEGAGPDPMAHELSPGLYALRLAQPLPEGGHTLAFTIQTADSGDLIVASLLVPAAAPPDPGPAPAYAGAMTRFWPWLAGGTMSLAVVGLAWVAIRRRASLTPG